MVVSILFERFFLFVCFNYLFLFDREGDMEKKESFHSLFTPKCPQQPETGQPKARIEELHPDLLCG